MGDIKGDTRSLDNGSCTGGQMAGRWSYVY